MQPLPLIQRFTCADRCATMKAAMDTKDLIALAAEISRKNREERKRRTRAIAQRAIRY